MSDGFDVPPDALRAAAEGLRSDAVALDEAGASVQRALDLVLDASGPGPVTGAAAALLDRLADAVAGVRARIDEASAAFDGAATEYQAGDGAVATTLPGSPPAVAVPGLGAR